MNKRLIVWVGLIGLLSGIPARGTDCNLNDVSVVPLSGNAQYDGARVKVVNTGACRYKVHVQARGHNPPYAAHQDCPSCCPSNGNDPGTMCDCMLDHTVEVGPYATVYTGGCVHRRCGGCGTDDNNVCDRGFCSQSTTVECSTSLNCPNHANGEICNWPCIELSITEAAIVCYSGGGQAWSSEVYFPLDVCGDPELVPRQPCASCMPAWGVRSALGCQPLGPSPSCIVDDTNGSVMVPAPTHNFWCMPFQRPGE